MLAGQKFASRQVTNDCNALITSEELQLQVEFFRLRVEFFKITSAIYHITRVNFKLQVQNFKFTRVIL